MRCHTKPRKLQKQPHLRQKKLSRAVQLAVLSMSLTPATVLADVQLDEGLGAAAFLGSTITNTGTIAPAVDYLNVDEANTQLTGAIVNSGTITAGDDAFDVRANSTIAAGDNAFYVKYNSTISGDITNSGTIAAGYDAFDVFNNATISGAITNSGTITAARDVFRVGTASTISGGIVNSGTITGGTNAFNITGTGAAFTIANSGLINGNVILNTSTLQLNGLTSRVTGAVTGGAGSTVNGTFTTENTLGRQLRGQYGRSVQHEPRRDDDERGEQCGDSGGGQRRQRHGDR